MRLPSMRRPLSFRSSRKSKVWAKSAFRAARRARYGCRSIRGNWPRSACRCYDVRKSIEATTVDIPKGQIDGAQQAFEVGNNDQLFNARDFLNAVIAYRSGSPVLFKDIGDAVEGLENEKLAGWYNGEPAVIINVQRQPGANIIKVADAVEKLLPEIKKSSPEAIKVAISADRTTTIRAAVADVQQTLAITVALVVLVIFLFLRKFWATLIPSVTLPVSLIATFASWRRSVSVSTIFH